MEFIFEEQEKPIGLSRFAEENSLSMRIKKMQDGTFTADFFHIEVREGDFFLASPQGRGHSAQGAINQYLSMIAGKTLVENAMIRGSRREICVPKRIYFDHDALEQLRDSVEYHV